MKVFIDEFIQWFDFFISLVPGRVGTKFRSLLYVYRFGAPCKVQIEKCCEFIKPEKILFGRDIGVGQASYFNADGGNIKVGHGTKFNKGVHINAAIGGNITIGNSCLIGPNVLMRTANHKFENPHLSIQQQGHTFSDIIIGDDVWIGANVIVLSGITVGTGSVVGAGSVVSRSIPKYSVAVGNPAKVIKQRLVVS